MAVPESPPPCCAPHSTANGHDVPALTQRHVWASLGLAVSAGMWAVFGPAKDSLFNLNRNLPTTMSDGTRWRAPILDAPIKQMRLSVTFQRQAGNACCGFVSETISNSLTVFSRVIMEDIAIKSNDFREFRKAGTVDNLLK